MRGMLIILSALFFGAAGPPVQAAHTQARLILARDTARPGDTVLAAVHLHMDPNWHTYWKNPGTSGMATTIDWQAPKGVTPGEIQWPAPEKLTEEEQVTYIYSNEVVLLVPLQLDSKLAAGPVELKAKLSWLECELKCIPGSAPVQAMLNIGTEQKPSKDAELIAAWQKKVPKKGVGLSAHAWWEGAAAGDLRRLLIEWNSTNAAATADFFPYASEQFEVQANTAKLPSDPGKFRLRAEVKKFEGDWPKQISGVLIEQTGAEKSGNEVELPIQPSGLAVAASSSTGLAA